MRSMADVGKAAQIVSVGRPSHDETVDGGLEGSNPSLLSHVSRSTVGKRQGYEGRR